MITFPYDQTYDPAAPFAKSAFTCPPLETLTLPGIYVVGDDQGDEVVLGRDVLNRLRVLLDGPRRVSQVLE